MTLFATAVAYVSSKGTDVSLTNSVVPLFSVVVRSYDSFEQNAFPHSIILQVGLILVFRCVVAMCALERHV